MYTSHYTLDLNPEKYMLKPLNSAQYVHTCMHTAYIQTYIYICLAFMALKGALKTPSLTPANPYAPGIRYFKASEDPNRDSVSGNVGTLLRNLGGSFKGYYKGFGGF